MIPSTRPQQQRLLLVRGWRFRCSSRRGGGSNTASATTTMTTRSIATVPVDEASVDAGDDERRLQEDLAAAIRPYHRSQRPLVVRGAAAGAPATKEGLWSSWDYWDTALAGHGITGSVEIGGSYGNTAGAERAEIPFEAYLSFLRAFEENHGRTGSVPGAAKGGGGGGTAVVDLPPDSDLVYMAQNDLPAPLWDDAMIPDFCRCGDDDIGGGGGLRRDEAPDPSSSSLAIGRGSLYSVMLWLGPRGCVSPLHQDPLDNCLIQHLGRKRVLLFEPGGGDGDDGGWHYAGCDGQQSNTSPVDPELPDRCGDDEDDDTTSELAWQQRRRYPRFFEEAPSRFECVLEPGDLLYIPSRWWHHVRSIDTSASVNVWWR